ncbi:MAG: FIST N-terminal domain-containing protein [Lachnospiraceae bacterium]|nr:FIST N-terminal domain-containing protein [Lachnospiraceae bacterium]
MKSITLFTEEIDDYEDAAAELKEQLEGFELCKNTIGILYINADNDIAEMMNCFTEAFDFPLVGSTALAQLNSSTGYCDAGITMIVLTADDCQFDIGMAEGLTCENYEEQITAEYQRVKAISGADEKLIIAYGGKITGSVGDDFIHVFDKLSNGVPVFGGLASDGFSFTKYFIFSNEKIDHFGLVFVLISGNVKPLFACEYSVSTENGFSAVVTKSKGNMILELNRGKFLDVLKEEGVGSDNSDQFQFIGSPFTATLEMEDGAKVRVLRFLTIIDQPTRSGGFLGGVPEGSGLGIAVINRDDVEKSVAEALRKLLEQMSKENEYKYSTFLFSSCGGRYLLLTKDRDAEARAIQTVLPENVSAAGFYSYGEFAPVTMEDSGKSYNVFHNSTFTVLAM